MVNATLGQLYPPGMADWAPGPVWTDAENLAIFFYFILTWCFVPTVLHFAICLYLQHTTQTSMPPAGFEHAIPAGDRPQTLALDRSATRIGIRSPDRTSRSQSL